jgi:23S rRNA (pseudouridine1915-N3)-methyltransferase
MNIKILCVGKIKEQYWNEAINEYCKRITSYSKIQIIEVSDEPTPDLSSEKLVKQVKEKEATKLLQKIDNRDYVICLTLNEKQLDSISFAHFLEKSLISGGSCITFVIGGSLGLGESILKRANYKLTFSELTFTHQMARVILLEQIYRAFKILNNETYHK